MVSPLGFLRETQDELKKVTWPTRAEVIRLTGVVIIVSLAIGIYIGGLDYVFATILQTIAKK